MPKKSRPILNKVDIKTITFSCDFAFGMKNAVSPSKRNSVSRGLSMAASAAAVRTAGMFLAVAVVTAHNVGVKAQSSA